MLFNLVQFSVMGVSFSFETLFIATLGLLAGAASMAIYHRFSPQEKIRELKHQINDVQSRLSRYEGDFTGAMTLTRQNLALAFRRLGLALLPSVTSSLPVLFFLPLIAESFVLYFIAVAVSALTVKFVWNVA